jgi:RNA polymerase sigma factor (sigma-70 family)
VFREKEVIESCKSLNSDAQKSLYEHYLPFAYNLCRRYVTDTDELKDVIQEGFIKVFISIKKFRFDGAFEGWLKRIFINTTLNHLRDNKKYRHNEEIDDNLNIPDSSSDETNNAFYGKRIDKKDIEQDKVDFEIVKDADFSQEELMDALNNLPDGFRIVFNLFCIEGLGHEEIAAMLKIDHATSRSRLNRARALLKKVLFEKGINKVSTD